MLKIYYMNVKGGCSFVQAQKLDSIIHPDRLDKIQRQRNASAANKQRLISAFLQYCLAKELGIGIAEVKFEYGPHGKPKVAGQEVEFNMSHSGDYVVLAISDDTIGIDVESKKQDRLHIAKRFFCDEEYSDIMSRDGQRQQERRFLELWTMKEAAVKYLGTGLQTGFDTFLIENEKGFDCVSRTDFSQGEQVWFSTLFLDEEKYCVSVCSNQQQEICNFNRESFTKVTLDEIEYVVTNS